MNSVNPVISNEKAMLQLFSFSHGIIMETPSQGFMKCTECGQTKPHSEMTGNALNRTNRWKQCKECYRAYMAGYRSKTREAYNKYQREWRKPIQKQLNEKWTAQRKQKLAAMSEEELAVYHRNQCEITKRCNAKIKEEIFAAYGGWKCACCGESEKMFLSIDHVNNNGKDQLKAGDYSRSSTHFYRWLKKNGFPEGYQVLCLNCNLGKHLNGGICPHKARCNDYGESQ